MTRKPPERTPRGALRLVTGDGGRPSTKRLDYLTRALVLKLRAAEPERSLASIAEVVGVSEASARRIVQAHTTDAKGLTRELLVSGVLDRLDDWAKAAKLAAAKGYHQPSKDWLEAAQVTEAKPAATVNVDARPTIVLNMPFRLGAILPPPEAVREFNDTTVTLDVPRGTPDLTRDTTRVD